MLNTSDLHFFYDLNNDSAIVHLLHHSAPLSPCLLLSLIWSLNLGPFYAESIAITPHWFAWPFLTEAVATLKHAVPAKVPSIVEGIIVGIYQNIVRSDRRVFDETERSDTLKRYHDIVLELLTTFMTPDVEKMESWTKMRKSRYMGRMVFRLLTMITKCADMFRNQSVAFRQSEADEVFGCLTYVQVESKELVMNQSVFGTLSQLHNLLLNTLQFNLLLVTVSTFIDWIEVDIDDELTLQRQVAEAAYAVEQLIRTDNRFEHDVLLQLQSISMKPKTLRDVIRESTLGEIMCKLDSLAMEPEIREQWLDEFVARGLLVMDNMECLETLEGNVEHMQPRHLRPLMRGLFDFAGNIEDQSSDKLREVIIRTARRFGATDLREIISFSLELTPDGVDLEQNSLRSETIQMLNRCSESVFTSTEPLIILLQNPVRFFEQLLATSLVADQPQTIICNFLDSLSPTMTQRFVQRSLLDLINRAANLPADEAKRLSTLIVRLHSTQFPSHAVFFRHFYQSIAEASRNQNLPKVSCLASALLAIMKSDATTELAAPLLVMCSTLLDYYRWDLATFNEQHAHLVEILIDIIHELRKRLLPIATTADKEFVLQRVAHLKPITRFYLHKLQFQADTSELARWPLPVDFARTIMGGEHQSQTVVDLSTLPKDVLLERMFGAVVRCTRKECLLLAHYELLRPHWFHAVRLVSRIVGRIETQAEEGNAARCNAAVQSLRHCGQMLAIVVRVSTQSFSYLFL